MARHIGPKNRLSRKMGIDLFNKGIKLRRLNIPPGVHGHKAGKRKQSEFGLQLMEKQKVRLFYGIMEGQFKLYFLQASKHKGAKGEILLQLLERRLDNVLVRAGFCPTRAMARQLVVHNHVLVNGQVVNRPSYRVGLDEVITLSTKGMSIPVVADLITNKGVTPPEWLAKKAAVVKVIKLPERKDVTEEFNEQAIVEFYSR